MEWRENKFVGIGAGVVFLICIGLALAPFGQRIRESRKAEKEFEEWHKSRTERYILDEYGNPIGPKK